MKVIIGERATGKTTELIKEAADTGYYIVCNSPRDCYRIQDQAKQMGLNIPFPITHQEFVDQRFYGKGVKGVLIDDVERLLQTIGNLKIHACSIEASNNDISKLNKL